MGDWTEFRLEELADIVTGSTPKAAETDAWGYEVDFVTPTDQTDQRETSAARRLSKVGAERLRRRIVPPRSTALTCIGSTIGKVTMNMAPTVTNQQINTLIARDGVCDPMFLYYLIKGWSPSLRAFASGSATPIVNKTVLGRFTFDAPGIVTQTAIGEVLGALDDKIAANERVMTLLAVIEDLEALRTVRSATETVRMDSIARVTKGISYRSADLTDSRTALVTLKSIDRRGRFSYAGFKPYTGVFKPEQRLTQGDIVLAQTDLTQKAEVVGRAVRVPRVASFDKLVASLDLAVVRPSGEVPVPYLLGALRQRDFIEHCRANTSGTTVLHLGRGAIESYQVPLANDDVMDAYSRGAAARFQLADALASTNASLVMTRDELLPLLMSGKLRVREAEKVVEGVL